MKREYDYNRVLLNIQKESSIIHVTLTGTVLITCHWKKLCLVCARVVKVQTSQLCDGFSAFIPAECVPLSQRCAHVSNGNNLEDSGNLCFPPLHLNLCPSHTAALYFLWVLKCSLLNKLSQRQLRESAAQKSNWRNVKLMRGNSWQHIYELIFQSVTGTYLLIKHSSTYTRKCRETVLRNNY